MYIFFKKYVTLLLCFIKMAEGAFMKNGMSFGKKMTLLLTFACICVFICSVVTAIVNVRRLLTTSAHKKISEVTEIAVNILDGYEKRVEKGELTEAQAKALAVKDISSLRYQGKNYVWVMDYNCIYFYHPVRPYGFDGKTLVNKKGEHYIKDLADNAINNKDVYLLDYSVKPGDPSKKKYPKFMAGRAYPKWQWVVATGIYVDSIDKMAWQTFYNIFIVNIISILLILLVINKFVLKRTFNFLNEITEKLKKTAVSVSESAFTFEESSQTLAKGSNEQASAVQETSASMEETSSMVKQNNDNTKQATILAKNAREYATESAKATKQMMETMNELETSSQEISNVIKAIDEIAFQTNILSLNAAVEAARAGEVGKGFAVVAEEVRNLAQRSANAAKDTGTIIENNIALSKRGFEMAKNVDSSLNKITDEVVKVDEILDEIAVATNEQAQGIEQINRAIRQMEDNLDENAKIAENTSQASKDLMEHSDAMNDVVDKMSNAING